MFCPVCDRRTTSQRVVNLGCCYKCSKHPPQGFELTGSAKDKAIAEFMAWIGRAPSVRPDGLEWLDGPLPSERYRLEEQERIQRLAGSAIARLQIARKRNGDRLDSVSASGGTER